MGGRGGLGWVGLGQGLAWSPTHGPRRLPCRTRLGGRTRVSGHKAYRTVDRPQTPRWRSRAGDAAVPVCMCPCVSRGGGGGLWHTCSLHCCSALAHMARGSVCLVLQAPAGRLESLTLSPPGEMWAWARYLHVTRTCYPTTPRLPSGTGRRWYVARLGSDPHSLTALGTGGAASRAGSGSHGRGRTLGRWRGTRAQSVLPCPGCHQCWLHWLRRYSPRRRGGPEGTTPEWPLRWGAGGGGVALRPPCSRSGRRPAVLLSGSLRVAGALPSGARVRSGLKCRPGMGGVRGGPWTAPLGAPSDLKPPLCHLGVGCGYGRVMWGAASFLLRCARCLGTPVWVRGSRSSRRCPYRAAVPPEGGAPPRPWGVGLGWIGLSRLEKRDGPVN